MPTLLDAYKEHPVYHNHLTPVDFYSLKELPDTHAWPSQYATDSLTSNPTEAVASNSIPVIDLNDPNAADHMYRACETWGAFQVVNHDIPAYVIRGVDLQARRLFSLPFQDKMRVLRSPDGAAGYGVARITPFFPKLMWHEGFTMVGDSSIEHSKELWPKDYSGFCEAMDEYQIRMKSLAEKLVALILKSLNIPQGAMKWTTPANGTKNPICAALHLNSYPPCPDPTRATGLAQHTDTLLFTILHQTDGINGLQIHNDRLGWVPVNQIPGAFVVHVGDLLHILSNGRFLSVLHRAVVNKKVHRISVAYFYGPPMDFQVSPVLKSSDETPLFKSFEVKEYINIRSKNPYTALSLIKR